MSTIRSEIVDAFADIIESKGFWVKKSRMLPLDFGTTKVPGCYVFVDREEKILSGNDAVVNKETWVADVVVFLLSKEADVEDNLSILYSELFKDNKLDSVSVRRSLVKLEYFTVQIDRELVGVSSTWRVVYRHKLGDMETY